MSKARFKSLIIPAQFLVFHDAVERNAGKIGKTAPRFHFAGNVLLIEVHVACKWAMHYALGLRDAPEWAMYRLRLCMSLDGLRVRLIIAISLDGLRVAWPGCAMSQDEPALRGLGYSLRARNFSTMELKAWGFFAAMK